MLPSTGEGMVADSMQSPGSMPTEPSPWALPRLRITGVEQYLGERDLGSRAFPGNTSRNKTMFGPAGHIYCHFTDGMHHALNLVTTAPGRPYGHLVRAGDIVKIGGQKITVFKHRAVLHTALRAPREATIFADGHTVVPKVHEVLDKTGTWSSLPRLGAPLTGRASVVPDWPRPSSTRVGAAAHTFLWRVWAVVGRQDRAGTVRLARLDDSGRAASDVLALATTVAGFGGVVPIPLNAGSAQGSMKAAIPGLALS